MVFIGSGFTSNEYQNNFSHRTLEKTWDLDTPFKAVIRAML